MELGTGRRRATVRWTSHGDDGDAAEAVAELEAWLAANPVNEADWDGVLTQIRDGLLRASLEPLLMSDPLARGILLGLSNLEDVDGLDAALDALLGRAAEIAEAREMAAIRESRGAEHMLASGSRRRMLRM